MADSGPQPQVGDALSGKRVLVTGATGFIGYHLCEALVAHGAEVHGLARSVDPERLPVGCRPTPVDLGNLDTVRETVTALSPDVIYHLAGTVTAERDVGLVLPMLLGNLMPAAHMLIAANDVGCERFIYAGSSEESDLAHSVASSPYAGSKAASSAYVRMFHRLYTLPTVLLRPFSVYGPRQHDTKLIPYATRSLLRGESPQLTSGDQVRDFVYVKDVARAFVLAAVGEGVLGETLDVGTGIGISVREAVALLADIVGVEITPILGHLPRRIAEEDQVAESTSIKNLLGWEPRWTLREGLADTVTWYSAA